MLLSILFASLGRLADLSANGLPLVVLVLLDGVHKGGTLFDVSVSISGFSSHQQHATNVGKGEKKVGANYLILSKLGIVHILVPVLLDGAFSAGREGLFGLRSALVILRIRTQIDVPWQSQPNCYPHRASASSDAPLPESKGYWCDFSSLAERSHRWLG